MTARGLKVEAPRYQVLFCPNCDHALALVTADQKLPRYLGCVHCHKRSKVGKVPRGDVIRLGEGE